MRKQTAEIWGVIAGGRIQLDSVGVGRNFSTKRYLGKKHSKQAWKRAYNNGARLIRLYVIPYNEIYNPETRK